MQTEETTLSMRMMPTIIHCNLNHHGGGAGPYVYIDTAIDLDHLTSIDQYYKDGIFMAVYRGNTTIHVPESKLSYPW